jgi:hypothetical protein
VDERGVVEAIINVFSNSHPFSGSNALYSAVTFTPEYPLGTLDVPTVSLVAAGGPPTVPRGLGTQARIAWGLFDMDVLAETSLDCYNLWAALRNAIMRDYQNDDTTGTVGLGYLRGLYIRRVIVEQPRSAPWDEAGRIKRLTGTIRAEFLEGV